MRFGVCATRVLEWYPGARLVSRVGAVSHMLNYIVFVGRTRKTVDRVQSQLDVDLAAVAEEVECKHNATI